MNKNKILLDGFHVSFDGRGLFMQEVFRYPKLREEVLHKLLEEGELEEWTKNQSATIGGGCFVHLEFREHDLITMFEKINKGGRELEKLKDKSPQMKYYCSMLQGDETEIKVDLDGILLVAYGLVNEEKCRQKIKQLFTEPERYYAKFEASRYRECNVMGCISVEYLWDMRLIIGILLELQETKEASLYQKVMQVIYCGYATLKKDIKKHSYMTGDMIKEVNSNFKNMKEDAMQLNAQLLITYIIMEDLGINIMWDFSIGTLLPFMEHYTEELEKGVETDSVDEKTEAKQSEWKKKFLENYGTQLSIRSLLMEKDDHGNSDAVAKVMSLFGMNPRKFQEYELTEEEQRLVTAQKETWNSKIYWSVLIIAQLCKYIRGLEKRFVTETSQHSDTQNWLEEEKRRSDLEKQAALLKENEILKHKIDKMEQSFVEHMQMEKHLQKQINISENKLRESQKEIANLKEYIYYLSKESPKECEVEYSDGSVIDWEEKHVLVLGGHPGWQNKLRAHYPEWQFLVSEQKNQIGEAVKGKEYIICNTQMLSHACYYKLLACVEEGQKILYVCHTNIERGMREIERQLRGI